MISRAKAKTPSSFGLRVVTLRNRAEYAAYCRSHSSELAGQRSVERELAAADASFAVPGRCAVCNRDVAFQASYAFAYEIDGILTPNWREHLRCPNCGLTNRTRATIHVVTRLLRARPTSTIYLTEQRTGLFRWMDGRFRSLVGSEFFGDRLPYGACDDAGVRNEDITRLTFADGTFDYVISLDVLEHVPDYRAALRELQRVLKPGGRLLLSVPFRSDLERNLVRARIDAQGEIEHLEPPEYHGDPIRPRGCLAFYHYGWELLDRMSEAGFDDVHAMLYWSRELGYLGRDQVLFLARRPTRELVARFRGVLDRMRVRVGLLAGSGESR